ncbi:MULTISPECIES: leucine-rich repeat domain-containing protein [unclassified Chryseobacterium]|uniref:leucine-rich repeat domain-containing protein n=1 Tax=unclassified Chryseobacterium TaxID=2593645 RepID=UPI001625CE78|nr:MULTISPECIES: leucine-rich repeat domain-containing protein [unclassified Chryseobacterium]
MNKRIQKIENHVQDRNSVAWKKLCEYIDRVAEDGREEFSLAEELGYDLFSQIHTLPETISKLKKVKKVRLYGSKLKRIPPEIGEMESLEYFEVYTSYDLHWFPYEITHCKNLKSSIMSTRAVYGNYKNRMGFPDLNQNPVRYSGETVQCSVCRKTMSYEQTNQLWISLWVGIDVMPLLANLCSEECTNALPQPPENYIQYAHKGSSALQQPPDENERFEQQLKEYKLKKIRLKLCRKRKSRRTK